MSSHHGTSTVQALYRTFILPALQSRRISHQKPSHATLPKRRTFSTTPSRLVYRGSAGKTFKAEERTQKWDDEITSRIIHLVDPATNKLAPQPSTRYDILNTLDRKTHRLIQVTPDPKPDSPEAYNFIPVCKIVSKKDLFDSERRRRINEKERKADSKKVASVKTLELNWAIEVGDLKHRLERMGEFLAEGRRVEIVLAAKKQGRKATRAECEGLLRRIGEVVEGVRGARELKGLEGKMGGFATLVLQGKTASGQESGGEG
ncbi:hypothetical protein BAUCODRAFT_67597 [Baudoinia panamericana UAMH 10762]|uniref:Uncharacterized protein n=1 Tax=Baudoinia panamericana (strain UAMH 10762) TaxID=717646 RepID=M2MP16_BAUPA|nr:uncharacterized protein BAUCODRAFT_67597 [Baudoinia panamericana UAMH 10762]EMC98446.1 hypothetical protein BAUCODRAFT_67597 [Baudoinia panamericana UAMH 10762]